MSEREELMDLIRNEYDPAPSHYRMGDDWDDGAGRIADAILADRTLLLRKHAEEIERLRAALRKIANPIGYFQEYAKQEGREIDGHMAVQISKDPGWLSSEAAKALSSGIREGKS